MLYDKSKEKDLSLDLFSLPTSEYRGTPFWSWNSKLDTDLIKKQIGQIQDMGMGGFHIHCRVGLNTEYLSEEFFSFVKIAFNEAEKRDMLCWLYDEDRWPSGSAGGLVTKDPAMRSRFLVFIPGNYKDDGADEGFMSAAKAVRSNNRSLIGKFEIHLDADGNLKTYKRNDQADSEDPSVWEAYLEISGDTPWFNNQAYVNTLDSKAIDKFIETTHEKYLQNLGKHFGKRIPAIFTDEPQTSHKEVLRDPFERKAVILPYTNDLDDSFFRQYGISLLDHLPALLWESTNPEDVEIRYDFHCHICDRFSEAFCDNIGHWCDRHHLSLTGHMMSEWTLYTQTVALGEVMRPLKAFHLPGIDMLCDRRELSTAKQAQSVAHQYDREGVMSELYGVTGWNFDFRNHKLAGDWQAALGVTVRVLHLTWMSMEGEAKRDYPASIGYQSPWYKEYSYIEDHFARLNTAMTRGRPVVRIAVIHPIESYWLYWGNQVQTATVRQDLEDQFTHIVEWLLYGLQDFDFISESLLENESSTGGQGTDKWNFEENNPVFIMGSMKYDVVIVPGCHTLRKHTLDCLSKFREAGGKIIFMGCPPVMEAAKVSKLPADLAKNCTQIEFTRGSLLSALEPFREIDIQVIPADGHDVSKLEYFESGTRASNLIYQLRRDGSVRWLFISHVNKPGDEDIAQIEKWDIKIKGEYIPTVYNTLNGTTCEWAASYNHGNTCITYYASFHDSLLLRLVPGGTSDGAAFHYSRVTEKSYLPAPKSFHLEEPNVYLLDIAEYAFDDGDWQPEDELLRIDNKFREKLGYPLRMEALAQPWVDPDNEKISHKLHLRFYIASDQTVVSPCLALEHPEQAVITVNSQIIIQQDQGWFTDESIRKIPLPDMKIGSNTIQVEIDFGKKTNLEWMYLLGDFALKTAGAAKEICEVQDKLLYGSIVGQGMPFYSGNISYETEIQCDEGKLYLEISQYRGALIKVWLDGNPVGRIIFAPYILCCGYVAQGTHRLTMMLYGNRANTFGALHNCDVTELWYGPNLWRTTGNRWSYEYQLSSFGILTTPKYWIKAEDEYEHEIIF